MDLPDPERSTLFNAGTEALRFNAPLGDRRAEDLAGELGRLGPRSVVDLGCGRGELARVVAARLINAAVVGVDTDRSAIECARRLTVEAGLEGRVRFDVADAADWSGQVDAAICVGAAHAFGGPRALLGRLTELVPAGAALVADGVWEADPDPWCVETFGDLPSGADGLTSMAEAAGWAVVSVGLSTQAEWDAFEEAWLAGVRSVGTATAEAFADERSREYQDRYRGVLGFCWLVLNR